MWAIRVRVMWNNRKSFGPGEPHDLRGNKSIAAKVNESRSFLCAFGMIL